MVRKKRRREEEEGAEKERWRSSWVTGITLNKYINVSHPVSPVAHT